MRIKNDAGSRRKKSFITQTNMSMSSALICYSRKVKKKNNKEIVKKKKKKS